MEDSGHPFDQEKVFQSILTNRLGKMVAIHNFGQYFRGQIYLDKPLYILRVKMYDAVAVLMMMVILT